MRKIEIMDSNDRLIATLQVTKATEYSLELIESHLGRKLKKGEQIVFNREKEGAK